MNGQFTVVVVNVIAQHNNGLSLIEEILKGVNENLFNKFQVIWRDLAKHQHIYCRSICLLLRKSLVIWRELFWIWFYFLFSVTFNNNLGLLVYSIYIYIKKKKRKTNIYYIYCAGLSVLRFAIFNSPYSFRCFKCQSSAESSNSTVRPKQHYKANTPVDNLYSRAHTHIQVQQHPY